MYQQLMVNLCYLVGSVLSCACSLSFPATWESWLWAPEACLAKHQLLWSTFRESVINLSMYHLLRWVWKLLLSQETLPVLPQSLVAAVVTAAWGEQGSAVLPAAGRGAAMLSYPYLDFGSAAEGGMLFMAQFSLALLFELFLPFLVAFDSQEPSCTALEHDMQH